MRESNSHFQWLAEEIEQFEKLWLDGATINSLAKLFKRSTQAIKSSRKRFGFPARPSGSHANHKGKLFGQSILMMGPPILSEEPALPPETDNQADAWSGITFFDDPRALRREAPLRGLPGDGLRSITGCAAAMTASAL